MVCIVPPKKAEYQDSGAQHSRNITKGPKGKYKIKIKYQTVLGFKDFNATRIKPHSVTLTALNTDELKLKSPINA